jgi:tripartite-type tricarboxylate transporter receptor subunit TctC
MHCKQTLGAFARLLYGAALVGFFYGDALAQTPFYQGKTITVIQGREPGGTGDMRSRAVTQFLQKYIPGNLLPPGTPKEQVGILQEAMRKAFQDPQFPKEFKKLAGDDPEIVMPDVLERSIKELPRNPEVIELLKTLAGPNPLPAN